MKTSRTYWTVSVMLIRHTESPDGGTNSVYAEAETDDLEYVRAEALYERMATRLSDEESATEVTPMPKNPEITVYTVVTPDSSTTLLTFDEMKEFISGFTVDYMESSVMVLESTVDYDDYAKLLRMRETTWDAGSSTR